MRGTRWRQSLVLADLAVVITLSHHHRPVWSGATGTAPEPLP
jgi:hypothetical protein